MGKNTSISLGNHFESFIEVAKYQAITPELAQNLAPASLIGCQNELSPLGNCLVEVPVKS
jgi:hypothetical protein